MANYLPNTSKQKFLQARVTAATDLRMLLLTSSHTSDPDNDDNWDDINANEASGTGYTSGGQSITNIATRADDVNDRGELTYDDVVWDASGGSLTAAYAAIVDWTGTASTSEVWGVIELDNGNSVTATNDTFTVGDDNDAGGIGIG